MEMPGIPEGSVMTLREQVAETVAGELAAAARDCADGVALYHPDGSLTFAQLRDEVWRAAAGLAGHGVKPGTRVALWAPNTLDTAVALLGVLVAGGVVVPLNTRYRSHETAEILASARCEVVIAPSLFLGRQYAAQALDVAGDASVIALGDNPPQSAVPWGRLTTGPAAEEDAARLGQALAAQSGEDVVVIQYTSGTTGRPRGAMLRQGPMLATAATWCDVVGMRQGDVYPVTYPLSHVGGFKTGLLTTLTARATAVLIPVITAESVVAAINDRGATVFNGPPPVLRSVLAAARDGQLPAGTRIREVITGSAIVPPQLVRELAAELGVANVIIAYGLTEATGVCTMTRRGDSIDLVCETLGAPIEGVQVRIDPSAGPAGAGRAAGEIEVRGPNVMVGYLEDQASTAQVTHDGWLRTGDIGWIGEDGYVRIAGRAKDMVIVGGFNVYPAEIEHVIADHPAVSEAAVVGVPDERLGEVTVAYVVAAGQAAVAPGEVIEWCRERLANFKVPRKVWIVPSLPRGSVGKVAKPELRDRAVAALRGEG
jgi:acyl-CoA synthetase (AMP-forming)/AMP-acid ligase II